MPFQSEAQRRFMFSQHPELAKRWTAEAKAAGQPAVQPGSKRGFDGLARKLAEKR